MQSNGHNETSGIGIWCLQTKWHIIY
jgi:hypothetical protein